MRRDAGNEVHESARRRLDQLRRELSNAGVEPPTAPARTEPAAPSGAVPPVGRHLRRRGGPGRRVLGWLDDRLPMTLRGRIRLGGREIALLVAIAALGLAAAAIVVLRSGAGRETVPLARPGAPASPLVSAPAVTTAATAVPAAGATPGASAGGGRVTVDVSGKVRRPGVVTLAAGSRVVDALRKAGGARRHVDLSGLNLARVLADGEQISVGGAGSAGPGVAASAASSAAATGQPGGPLVNINTASQSQLEALPDVGPVTAQKIVAWRGAHGSFSSVDELLEVEGIGEKTLAEMAPHLTL